MTENFENNSNDIQCDDLQDGKSFFDVKSDTADADVRVETANAINNQESAVQSDAIQDNSIQENSVQDNNHQENIGLYGAEKLNNCACLDAKQNQEEVDTKETSKPIQASNKTKKNGKAGNKKQLRQKPKKKRNYWTVKITIISFFLSGFFAFVSDLTASTNNLIIAIILLLFLIVASILFDGIGVAVTSCDLTPIMSMASRKKYGAKTALWLVKNNEKVSNVCNDVIGDIFGIISGACTVTLVAQIMLSLDNRLFQIVSIVVSSVVASLIIGGKAFLKNIAITNSKDFVMFVAKIVAVFSKEERKRKKKEKQNKAKFGTKKNIVIKEKSIGSKVCADGTKKSEKHKRITYKIIDTEPEKIANKHD